MVLKRAILFYLFALVTAASPKSAKHAPLQHSNSFRRTSSVNTQKQEISETQENVENTKVTASRTSFEQNVEFGGEKQNIGSNSEGEKREDNYEGIARRNPDSILLVNPIRGSHFFFMLEIGRALSSVGYNVTLLSLDPESRVSYPNTPLLRVILPKDPSFLYNVRNKGRSEACVRILAEEFDTVASINNAIRVPVCRDTVLDMYQHSLRYFHDSEWDELHRENQFKLIIAEERAVWAATLAARSSKIPIVMASPEFNYIMPKVKHNLDLLFSHEPGTFNIWFEETRGVIPKLLTLWDAINMAPFAMELESLFRPFLERKNLTSVNELTRQISLFFVNDYPSFSFPFSLPRTVVNIGTVGYSANNSLPKYIVDFLSKDRKNTIYMSFGSYVSSDFNFLERYGVFIDAAKGLNLKIIISLGSEKDTFSNIFMSEEERQFSDKISKWDHVLIAKWLPQKQLLKGGHVVLFVSHCGNNARMEAVYHTVPILCVPLYAEQPLIANLIRYRGFGDLLMKEDLFYSKVLRSLNSTLNRAPVFRENMARAVHVLKTAPSTVEQTMIHHVQLLIQFGKLDYLENKIIENKSALDLNNVDLLIGIFIVVLISWEVSKKLCSLLACFIKRRVFKSQIKR